MKIQRRKDQRSGSKNSQRRCSKQIKKINNKNLDQRVKKKSFSKKQDRQKHHPQIKQIQLTLNLAFQQFLFVKQHKLGRGGFGKVWKVKQKKSHKYFAMKQMSKALYQCFKRVIFKKSCQLIMNERKILSKLKFSFIVNIICSFHNKQNLYLVLDLLLAGDLRYHICKKNKFKQEQTRFIIACIFFGLQYLHRQGIIHRDIKPQNLILQQNGYVRITDFGIAKNVQQQNSNETSGTPGYMAPEVMCRQNHGLEADYYALGVIAYELMTGSRPYNGNNRKQIRDQILAKQIGIAKKQIPDGWSIESADFINSLIQRKPCKRLGFNGSFEVKQHPFLRQFPWKQLQSKKLKAPYIPGQRNYNKMEYDNIKQQQQLQKFIKQNKLNIDQQSDQQKSIIYQKDQFQGYTYYNNFEQSTSQRQSILPIRDLKSKY